ncbi:hypothetical protein BDF14DRAFT_1737323, partial [Spinellus fusiger]
YDWICQWENTDMNFLTNCMFLDKSTFNIIMKGHFIVMDNGLIHNHENIKKYVED